MENRPLSRSRIIGTKMSGRAPPIKSVLVFLRSKTENPDFFFKMKRAGNLIERITNIDNLYLAFYKAQRGKSAKDEALKYRENLHENIKILQSQIQADKVDVGNYHYFTIFDPKVRLICAAAFSERVLHHALMNVCHSYFEKNMIFDTYATRLNKGTYKALDKACKGMKQYQYVAKLDVRKYFDHISHEILKHKLKRIFKDEILLKILSQIIDSYSIEKNQGLPIGNLSSQYFANFYLSSIDHYAKEILQIPMYIRYMDDILLFSNEKQILKKNIDILENKMQIELHLSLKLAVIHHCTKGISFLGYHLFPNKILLHRNSKKRFLQKMKQYNQKLKNQQWSEKEYQNHITPLLAFVKKAYTKILRKKYCEL